MRTLCHYTFFLLEGKKKESLNACADWTAHEDMLSKAFPKILNLIWYFDILLVCLHCSVTQAPSQMLSVLLVLLHTLVACPHIDCWVVCGLCHLKQSYRYPAGLAFNSYQSHHSEGFWELRLSDRGSQTLRHTPMTSGSGSGRCHSGTHWPYMQDTLQR